MEKFVVDMIEMRLQLRRICKRRANSEILSEHTSQQARCLFFNSKIFRFFVFIFMARISSKIPLALGGYSCYNNWMVEC